MKWQSVVFDLDDTLYPEREYVLSGFRAVAAWMEDQAGISKDRGYEELRQLFERGVRASTFDEWLLAHQLRSDKLIKQLVEVYRDHSPEIRIFPEVPTALHLIRTFYRLGLISDGYLSVQQRKLSALQIASLFDCVVFSDTWGRESWKPSEKPFREAQKLLQTRHDRSVYVGDNPLKDFYGARICGWYTIWLKRAGGEYSHLAPPSPNHAPHLTVHSFQELIEHLTERTTETY